MQITLFYGCYYSSPSVKRASHTLVGPLVLLCHVPAALVPNYFRLLIPLSFAESARLFFSTSGHSSLTPPPRLACAVERCHSPPGHQMSSDAPTHLGSPVRRSFPSVRTPASHYATQLFTTRSAPSNLCLLHLHLALLDVLDMLQHASHKSSSYY